MLIQTIRIPNKNEKDDKKNQEPINPDILTEEERKKFIGATVPYSSLRKGNIVLMKGHPCKIVDISVAK